MTRILRDTRSRVLEVTTLAVGLLFQLTVWAYTWLLRSQYYLERHLMGVTTEAGRGEAGTAPRRRGLRSACAEGQAMVEYALVIAVIAVVVIAILVIFGQNILKIFTKVNSTMCSDTSDCS